MVAQAACKFDAKQVAAADPMHTTATRTFELRRWLVNAGSFAISIGLSTKDVTLRRTKDRPLDHA